MQKWPGTENFGNANTPWNVVDNETLNKVLTDRGSLATALSAGLLTNLANEDNATLISAIDELATSALDYRRTINVECDMASILAIYGACVFLGQDADYRFDYLEEANNWHKCRRYNGLFRANDGGDNAKVQLGSLPSLIDESYGSASVSNITTKDINIGVTVGTEEFGTVYPGVVDAILIVASKSLGAFSVYKSNDNRDWTPVVKSTYSGGTWDAGEKTIANIRGSGSGYIGKLILFANTEEALHFKAVSMSVPGIAYDVYEIYALNLQGELRYSSDLNNWNVAKRNTDYSEFLLFPFDAVRNEIRAVDYYLCPFDPTSLKVARIDVEHIEAYAATNAVAFGSDGLTRVITITDGELGTTGDKKVVTILNSDNYARDARKLYAHIGLGPRAVTDLALTAGGTTFQLADSSKRVTYCRYLLNSTSDDIGAYGDTSVVMGGSMVAWTEVSGTPSGNQYAINYNTGVVTTGNAIPSSSTVSFVYANPGAAAMEISPSGATGSWVGPGYVNRMQLLGTNVPAGTTTSMYVRSNLTYFTQTIEDVIRTSLLFIEMAFRGEKS